MKTKSQKPLYVTFVTILLLLSFQFCSINKKIVMKETYKNATIVDVRTPEEYASGHYPAAVNIPLDEVAARVEEFKKMPKPIVAYCRSGNRSGMAVGILKQHGIAEVVNAGGLDEVSQTLNK